MLSGLRVVRVPDGCWLVFRRGRSVVQCEPMLGPDWAIESLAEMSEGSLLDEASIASLSGALVASSGSDILCQCFKPVANHSLPMVVRWWQPEIFFAYSAKPGCSQ